MSIFKKPDEEVIKLLVASANEGPMSKSSALLAKALETPLRQGVLVGSNVENIFETFTLAPGAVPEYQLDIIAPGEEGDYTAYTIPDEGRIPERTVKGDYVMLPTFRTGNSVDWLLKHARDSRFDMVGRAIEGMMAGVQQKINNDCWHLLLSAGADRNILVYDADATAGFFTKRLVSLLKLVMKRNGGGNAQSIKRSRLTDLYVSSEALEDIRNWDLSQVDDVTRRQLFTASDDSIRGIFGDINLHELYELGEGQAYQDYLTGTLSGALQASDLELVIGLDLQNRDSFVMPIREEFQVFDDSLMLHRRGKGGVYGWMEYGVGCLDSRRVVLGSF
jgi:hypothetical protein